jgi:flavin-dependent dehydrogenase
MSAELTVDVAIIGGGPAGSTCASFLMKYAPRTKVAVFERERFPRDHVGESQLPVIGNILNEIGVWDKVERAGFPVKIGATYRWGRTDDLWDFEFIPYGRFDLEARPAKFAGQRTLTSFQVDRAIYDKILLDHAAEMGARVFEETVVRKVEKDGDRITSLTLGDGTVVKARYYVDCSGHTGVLRRAMGVETNSPTTLQNIAIWDYWQNAEWAVKIGIGGTRIQILSQGYGWVWFIPLGPTRTSIGLVIPSEYYKQSGKKPQELYDHAMATDPVLQRLLKHASSEEKLATTKDWSFLSDRLVGENWLLAGESAGFADPILSAGMSLAHMAGREVAYSIIALDRRDFDRAWLWERYEAAQKQRIRQHIQFADFWYTSNGQFSDLVDYTAEIAKGAGLDLGSKEAWQWLGTGGFIEHDSVGASFGGYSVRATKFLSSKFIGDQPYYIIEGANRFYLNLDGAEKAWGAKLADGRISRHRCLRRDGKLLPNTGIYAWIIQTLKDVHSWPDLVAELKGFSAGFALGGEALETVKADLYEALESMANDGWVTVVADPEAPLAPAPHFWMDRTFHDNRDPVPATS